MSITNAINNLTTDIKSLSWVNSVHEIERDPGGIYSVYLLPAMVEVHRNITSIKAHVYAFTLRLSIAGGQATAANIYEKMDELETIIEADRKRDSNANDTYIGETWELSDTEEAENGFVSFETAVFIKIVS